MEITEALYIMRKQQSKNLTIEGCLQKSLEVH